MITVNDQAGQQEPQPLLIGSFQPEGIHTVQAQLRIEVTKTAIAMITVNDPAGQQKTTTTLDRIIYCYAHQYSILTL